PSGLAPWRSRSPGGTIAPTRISSPPCPSTGWRCTWVPGRARRPSGSGTWRPPAPFSEIWCSASPEAGTSGARPAEDGEALLPGGIAAKGTGELAAGAADLLSVRHAHQRADAGVAQRLLEGADPLHRRRPERLLGSGVEGDQVHADVEPLAEGEELSQVPLAVVLPLDHRPLEEDRLRRLGDRRAERGQIPEARRGEEGSALLVVGHVEAHRQAVATLREELPNLGHHTHRGDGDPPRRDAEAGIVAEHVGGEQYGLEVVERLAHPHEDHVGGRRPAERAKVPRHRGELPGDLVRLQVAGEAEPTRLAEDAAARAADLGGEADRRPAGVGDGHRLDQRTG